ncbi:MAG: thioredoxin domain-containing protein [Patescibacteria group bacterium]
MEENQELTKQERRLLRQDEKEAAREKTKRARLMKRLTLWTLLFLGIGGAMFGLVRMSGEGTGQTATLLNTISATSWVKGNAEAKVTLIEYSDFQCPACGTYYPIVKKLLEDYGDRIRFVYRHFPLRQIHKNADIAAQAAEAAGVQGKFWEMHNAIFEHQRDWSESSDAKKMFIEYATTIGLDEDQFLKDLGNKTAKEKIDEDLQSGLSAGVNATPSFFLNGQKMPQPKGLDDFKRQLDAALLIANS